MVAAEFIEFLGKLQIVNYIGVEDFADKLSFLYSVLVLMLCTTIITVKQYLLSAISCYIPTVPSGSDFDKYLENYCWVHGTIPFLSEERIPQTMEQWALADQKHRINYYQWVPFMFGLQCVLFYLPRIVWQLICYNRTGTDLEHLINLASKAGKSAETERTNLVKHVAATISGMLFQHREYRVGRIVRIKKRLFDILGIFVVSKRLGTWLAFTYLIIKLLYLINAIGQLYLMQHFLGFNTSLTSFGAQLAQDMIAGRNWEQTRLFPRVSFCYLADIRQLGSINKYVAQCVLPVNMLNEKLYIFLWFWTAIVATCTALSIPLWFVRLAMFQNRVKFVKKFLRLNNQFQNADKTILKEFICDYLHHDGVFLLRMISMNAGDVIVAEVVGQLWENYVHSMHNPETADDVQPAEGTLKSIMNKPTDDGVDVVS